MMISWEILKPAARLRRKPKNEGKEDSHAHVRGLQGIKAEERTPSHRSTPYRGDRSGQDRQKSGRGVYVCDSMDCFNKAYENHGLEKSLKRPVSKDVYEALKAQIENG